MIDRRLLTGWSKLASGNAAAGVLQLIGLAIAAQALDVSALGVIVLIEAYVRIVDGIFNFQSVNVLTRFLAEAEHQGEAARFRGFIKAGFLIDGVTALFAFGIAAAALPLVGPYVGIPESWLGLAMLYCVVILTRILGVSEAVLRCFDKFWAIGLRGTVQGLLLVAGSAVAWWQGADAQVFLVIWMLSEIAANTVFLGWTASALRQHAISGLWRARARKAVRSAPSFWAMLWQTNLSFGIRLLSQDADLLIAGALLGPAAAGLLRAAKSIAASVSQFGRPLQQVASAPIARLWADKDYASIVSYAARIGFLAALAGLAATLAFVFLGGPVLSAVFGEEFAAASIVLVVLMLSRSIYLSGVALLPTMLTLGLGQQLLLSIVISTGTYFIAIAALAVPFGLIGIALAHIAFDAVWAAIAWRWVLRRVAVLRRG